MATTDPGLIAALKTALARTEPLPLFKAGKQEGLFTSRTGSAAEAEQALRDGLLEIVRSEAKGKAEIEFVRITPRGVQFLALHESPKAALEELTAALRAGSAGLPRHLEEMQAQVRAVVGRFEEMLVHHERSMQQLLIRAEEALRRLNSSASAAGAPGTPLLPWELDAVAYLDTRRTVSGEAACPMPELFAAVRASHADLTIPTLHEGLLRLRDRGTVRLEAFAGKLADLPEPEYALLDGAAVYVAVRR